MVQLPMDLLKINVVFPFFNALGVFFVVMTLVFFCLIKTRRLNGELSLGDYIGKNHRMNLGKITERNWEKSPNGIGKNHRTDMENAIFKAATLSCCGFKDGVDGHWQLCLSER